MNNKEKYLGIPLAIIIWILFSPAFLMGFIFGHAKPYYELGAELQDIALNKLADWMRK